MQFEFIIPQRPVSLQTKNRKNLQAWKNFVKAEASKTWRGNPLSGDLHLTLVYLYDTDPVDIDNIIKPIQDSLVGLVYNNDIQIIDVQAHRRHLQGTFDILLYPNLLFQGIYQGSECVYVRICQSKNLESYL